MAALSVVQEQKTSDMLVKRYNDRNRLLQLVGVKIHKLLVETAAPMLKWGSIIDAIFRSS